MILFDDLLISESRNFYDTISTCIVENNLYLLIINRGIDLKKNTKKKKPKYISEELTRVKTQNTITFLALLVFLAGLSIFLYGRYNSSNNPALHVAYISASSILKTIIAYTVLWLLICIASEDENYILCKWSVLFPIVLVACVGLSSEYNTKLVVGNKEVGSLNMFGRELLDIGGSTEDINASYVSTEFVEKPIKIGDRENSYFLSYYNGSLKNVVCISKSCYDTVNAILGVQDEKNLLLTVSKHSGTIREVNGADVSKWIKISEFSIENQLGIDTKELENSYLMYKDMLDTGLPTEIPE